MSGVPPNQPPLRPLAATTRSYPGAAPCNTTLQACIDASADGDSIEIVPGTYITASLSIAKAVSLIGAGASRGDVRLQPTSGRMINYTGATIDAQTVLSNLTVQNGDTTATSSSGGGIRGTSDGGFVPNLIPTERRMES